MDATMRVRRTWEYSVFADLAYLPWRADVTYDRSSISDLATDNRVLSARVVSSVFSSESGWSIPARAIHPNDSTGFAANFFVSPNEKVLAIRGTEFEDTLPELLLALLPGQRLGEQTILDLFGADLEEIIGLGLAIRQSTSLLNFILRALAPDGAGVAQYELRSQSSLGSAGLSPVPVGAPSFSLPHVGPAAATTWYWLETRTGSGLGLVAPGEQFTVVGHSLAGHLGALALRLFPQHVSQAVVFNAAGFDAPGSRAVTEAFVRMVTPLLPAAPATDFTGFGARLQHFASESSTHDDDLSIVPSVLTGIGRLPPIQLLRTESNSHGMDPLMDNLSVFALLERLMPDQPRDTLHAVFDAASAVAGDSAETLVDSLARLLLPSAAALPMAASGWLGYPATESSFAARSALHDTVLALDLRLDASPGLRMEPLMALDHASLVARARDSMAYRHALREYLPYALVGDDSLYAPLNTNGVLDTTAMSSNEIDERIRLLQYELSRRRVDGGAGSVVGAPAVAYTDLRHALQLQVLDLLPDTQAPIEVAIVFGTDAADTGPATAGSVRRDRLYGGAGNDRLGGGANDDVLDGGAHDDMLEGGDGADVLDGGPGNDTLYGASATGADDGHVDLLSGGEGLDRLYAAAGDVVRDRDGELRVRLGDSWVLPTGRSYHLIADDGLVRALRSDDALSLTLAYNRATRELRVGPVTVLDFLPGDLGLTLAAGSAPTPTLPRVTGTPGADRLSGGAVAELIAGGAGDDELRGNGGNDRLFGDTGRDALEGGEGADVLDGGSERDSLLGNAGDDTLTGGTGSDALAGGDGDDVLEGGDDDDVLGGGEGRDVLVGGSGDDLIAAALDFTRPGADWIVERHGPALGTLLRDPRAIRLLGFAAVDVSALNQPRDAAGDVLYGGDGDDLLFGSAGIDTIDGGAGNDTALGSDGDDVLFGAAGDDHLRGNGGADLLRGGDGDDFLVGHGAGNEGLDEDGADRLEGGAGRDELNGGPDDDVLTGGSDDDRLYGDDGDDRLDGESGNDLLVGDSGRDMLLGGDGDDRLFGNTGGDRLDGGSGADYLDGGDAHDRLTGGAGDDTLLGGDGDDMLDGDTGHDDLLGGSGHDLLDGGAGDDRLVGDAGNDVYRIDDLPGRREIVDIGGLDELHLADLHSLTALRVATDGEDLRIDWGSDRGVLIRAWRQGGIDRLLVGEHRVLDGRHLDSLARAGVVQALSDHGRLPSGSLLGSAGDDDIQLDASVPRVNAGGGDDRYVLARDTRGIALRIDDTAGANTLQFRGASSPQALGLALEGEDYVITLNGNRLTLAPTAIAAYAFDDGTVLGAGDFRLLLLNTVPLAPRLQQPLESRAVYQSQAFAFGLPAGSFIDLNPAAVLSYAATLENGQSLPAWLAFDPGTRRFSGAPPPSALGAYAIRVTATDETGRSAQDVFGLDVLPTLQRAPGAVFAHETVNGVNGFWIVAPESIGTTRPAPMLAALGDLNDDGFDDFLVGDTVRFGRARGFGAQIGTAALDGYDSFRLENFVSDGFRYADSALLPVRGDFNGDGIDDVLLPSPTGLTGDDRVLHGRRGRYAPRIDRQTLPVFSPVVTEPLPTLWYEGRPVLAPDARRIGDFNGDGREDWAVSIARDTATRSWRGIVFGTAGNQPVVLDAPNGTNALRLRAAAYPGYPYTEPDGALAASGWGPLLPLGDLNDDGRADVGLGSAPFLFRQQTVYGAVVLGRSDGHGGVLDLASLNGANGFLTTFPSPGIAYSAAHVLRAAGDLNGDGYDDFFAVDDANGAAYAVYGRVAFSGALHSGTAANDVIHAAPNAITHAGPGDDTVYVPLSAPGLVYGGSGRNAVVFAPAAALPPGTRVFHIDAFGGLQEDSYHVVGNTGVAIIHLHDPAGAPNRLQLGWNMSTFNFLLRQGSVTLDFGPLAPQIHLEDVDLDDVLGGPRTVDRIEFADGQVLTYAQLIARGFDVPGTERDEALRGSNVVDRITAFGGHDLITGGRGNDVLDGGTGDDIYVQAVGEGSDVIRDALGRDRVRFGAGITTASLRWRHETRDLVVQVGAGDELRLTDWHANRAARIERFEFADSSFVDVERLVNRAPHLRVNPQVLWLDAGQAFRFTLPSDWIVDPDPLDKLIIRLGADTAAGQTSLPDWLRLDAATRSVSGVVPAAFSGSVKLRITAIDPQTSVVNLGLRLEFGSGQTRIGGNGADILQGSPWSDHLRGGGGDDRLLPGNGNDVLAGEAGHDALSGGGGNDLLDGGTGNDSLSGGPGDDVYVFTRGSGVDRIDNPDAAGLDEIRFDDDGLPADFWFSRQGQDLAITRSGTVDRIEVAGWYAPSPARVDRINLDDQYALVAADVERLVDAMARFSAVPASGSVFAPLVAEQFAPVLAASWRPRV